MTGCTDWITLNLVSPLKNKKISKYKNVFLCKKTSGANQSWSYKQVTGGYYQFFKFLVPAKRTEMLRPKASGKKINVSCTVQLYIFLVYAPNWYGCNTTILNWIILFWIARRAHDVITQTDSDKQNGMVEDLKLFQARKQVFLDQFLNWKFGIHFPPISLRKCSWCLNLAGFQMNNLHSIFKLCVLRYCVPWSRGSKSIQHWPRIFVFSSFPFLSFGRTSTTVTVKSEKKQ